MTNQLLDPDICGDDGPITPEECALWLDAKYRRHGELEDRAAALWLRKLSARRPVEPSEGPASLVGALQDVVHTDTGPVRAGRSVKSGAEPLTELVVAEQCSDCGDQLMLPKGVEIHSWTCRRGHHHPL